MKLAVFSSDWGRQLHETAQAMGVRSRLLDLSHTPTGKEVLFTRPLQKAPRASVAWALAHIERGGASVQSRDDLLCYENRAHQMMALAEHMPEGAHITEYSEAGVRRLADKLGYPIVSKAPFGSGSKTVRALHDWPEARVEAQAILQGAGLTFPNWPVQQGELLWSRFLAGNSYMVRVTRITRRWGWAFQVHNRPNDWRASGSGVCTPLAGFADWQGHYDTQRVAPFTINSALAAMDALESRWCGLDMMMDRRDGKWRPVDVTLAWTLSRNVPGSSYDAPVFDLFTGEPHPRGLKGRDQWRILLEDLNGVGT